MRRIDPPRSAFVQIGQCSSRLEFYVSERNILIYPHPLLRRKSAAVGSFDKTLRQLAGDMQRSMYRAKGIGLAAPQVGVLKRVIVADMSEERNSPVVLINPTITRREGFQTREEGCLSIPGFYESVSRAETIGVCAQTVDGDEQVFEAHGLLATVIQHEYDHLDGRLFVDHLSQLKRKRIRKKLLSSRAPA